MMALKYPDSCRGEGGAGTPAPPALLLLLLASPVLLLLLLLAEPVLLPMSLLLTLLAAPAAMPGCGESAATLSRNLFIHATPGL
jgi:hypothetical protein